MHTINPTVLNMVSFYYQFLIIIGTLMGNWWEENELRKTTGITRTTTGTHLKKNHD